MANTKIIEKQIALWEKLKANPDKQVEKYKKMIEDLGTGEGLEGLKLKQYNLKKTNYTKFVDLFQKRSDSYQARIDKLKAKLPSEEPPPEETPEEEPEEGGTIAPNIVPASTETPVYEPGGENSAEEATVSDEVAAARGRKGKQKTILTSPEGVMATAQRMLKRLQRVA